MKFSLILSTAQLASQQGNRFGIGGMRNYAKLLQSLGDLGLSCNLYELPCLYKNPAIASPFSLQSGFALALDELDLLAIEEVQANPELHASLEEWDAAYQEHFGMSSLVNYPMARSLAKITLKKAYEQFSKASPSRRKEYEQFCQEAAFWLDDFALYEALRQAKSPLLQEPQFPGTPQEKAQLAKAWAEATQPIRYAQFVAFQQRMKLKKLAESFGQSLIVNLPFGVETASADVFFRPEVFAVDWQVGCSPEPHHGYPEQAWGVAAYQECSEGLRVYLEQRLAWLSRLGHGIFLDHLVGWCGQYVLPRAATPGGGEPVGHFLTTDPEEREQNILWFLQICAKSGLTITGEIAGDLERLAATNQGVERMRQEGHSIWLMQIPRWERSQGKLLALADYQEQSLVMLETHDTATLLQFLCNRKGRVEDHYSAWEIAEFARQVLALPLFLDQAPLRLEEWPQEIWVELLRRIFQGLPAQDLAMTLPSLITWLSPAWRNLGLRANINVQPGTSGLVGNEDLNWSLFGPELENLTLEPIAGFLKTYGARQQLPFAPLVESSSPDWEALFGPLLHRRAIFQDTKGQWRLAPDWPGAEWELCLQNRTQREVQGMLPLQWAEGFPTQGELEMWDLLKNERYRYPAERALTDGLFYRMEPGQRHHFLIRLA